MVVLLEAICPKPNLSRPGEGTAHKIYLYLLRDLKLQGPHHVHGTDITYIRLRGSWLYLVAVLDWRVPAGGCRYIVSWELSDTLQLDFVLGAVGRGLEQSWPQILNSDQGSHFTSLRYIELLEAAQVRISMDGRGRAFDNIFTERLWRSIKYECVYLNEFESPKEARQIIGEYIKFYNTKRPHQSLDYRTPAEVHFEKVAISTVE